MDTLKRNRFDIDNSLAEWNGGMAGKQAFLAGRPFAETSTYLQNAHSAMGNQTINMPITVNAPNANATADDIAQAVASKVSAAMSALRARGAAGFALQSGVNQ